MSTPVAVTIAGSDSGGGAGIQADLKTFAALGVYGASIIVALTAQNTRGVTGIHDVPPEFIRAQMDAVFSDLAIGAVKIGMLSQAASIEAVAKGLADHRATNIVLDPVMVATSGDRLLATDAVEALRRLLIPRALVITPNLPEAAALVEQLARAIQYSHDQGVIHRDLKPSNVMVGRFGEVQVMDWGLAKVLGERPSDAPQPRPAPPTDVSIVQTPRTRDCR